jgi:putative hemolysin
MNIVCTEWIDKMKTLTWILTLAFLLLTACAAPQTQPTPTRSKVEGPAATDTPQANMPNPASVYCEEQGNHMEIRTAADGSQSGVCLFADGSEEYPLRHGEHVLRGNNICRWWKTAPRAPQTAPAVQTVLHPSYEVLRFDLWEQAFDRPRRLEAIRWTLDDPDSIQALLAVSVCTE